MKLLTLTRTIVVVVMVWYVGNRWIPSSNDGAAQVTINSTLAMNDLSQPMQRFVVRHLGNASTSCELSRLRFHRVRSMVFERQVRDYVSAVLEAKDMLRHCSDESRPDVAEYVSSFSEWEDVLTRDVRHVFVRPISDL